MQIQTKKSRKAGLTPILGSLLGIAILTIILLWNSSSTTTEVGDALPKNDIETPTEVALAHIDYAQLIRSEDQPVYQDSIFSIYTAERLGKPQLIYVYKDMLTERQRFDNFFLHVYVKDSSLVQNNRKYVNLDFFRAPLELNVDNVNYYIFQQALDHASYKKNYIPLNDIKYINTGRFKNKVGRSQNISKLKVDHIQSSILGNTLEEISINVKDKAFQKIRDKRKAALEKGVLLSSDDDYVKGTVSTIAQKNLKVEFRLKGDWTDHLYDEKKWSYRFVMQDGMTLKGMRKFSVQHPRTRNFLWEWLFNKVVKDEDLVGLRYDFVNFTLNLQKNDTIEKVPVGIMALEEAFDKILIENNQKREGVILAFDESLYWGDQAQEKGFKLEHESYSKTLRSLNSAQIRVFNENKVLSDPNLRNQFNTAKDLLEGVRQQKYRISEVFDLDKLTTFVALSNLFGGHHGLVWHNIRIYYNPITNKLEPISYDSNSGTKINFIRHYPLAEEDELYQKALLQKLKTISSSEYINEFMNTYRNDFNHLNLELLTEFASPIDISILEQNSNLIKKLINPSNIVTANLVDYNDSQMRIEIKNLSDYAVNLEGLTHIDGRLLSTGDSHEGMLKQGETVIVQFELNKYFVNAFVSKKNKKGVFNYPKDIAKIQLAHSIDQINYTRHSNIQPYGINRNIDAQAAAYRAAHTTNYQDFAFLSMDSLTMTLKVSPGKHQLAKSLIVSKGLILQIDAGTEIDLVNNASIISNSAVSMLGTLEKPIKIYSSDSSGRGIFVTDAQKVSNLAFCNFDNLSFPENKLWKVSGSVNFHESEVHITNSSFTNNRSEDALNIIRSEFTMTDSSFSNTQSDAFDGDFVTGSISNTHFINSGNDGIDISGSSLFIKDIVIENPSDKAISAGENSQITGNNIQVMGGEIGVVSKDLSRVTLSNLRITDTRLGLSAFQKKSEYGTAFISIEGLSLSNVEQEHLIEIQSQLLIDNALVETVSNKVIDQMYGKEYGKSSR